MTTTTTRYIVYRCGSSNAANWIGPVGIFDGRGATARDRRDDAILQASDQLRPTIYMNQYLDARPWAHCSADDREAAFDNEEVLRMLKAEDDLLAQELAADDEEYGPDSAQQLLERGPR